MHDLRVAFRSLFSSPIVALVAILSLSLGIGANSTIFSIVDSLLLRPLPVEEPNELVLLVPNQPGFSPGSLGWTNPLWEQIRADEEAFQTAFAFRSTTFNLAARGRTDLVQGLWASGEFFDALGVPARLGRTFTTEDDARGGGPDGPVAVISEAFWQRRFGGATDVVGRRLEIERVPFTIVGVTPAGFFGVEVGRSFDVAVPIGTEPLMRGESSAFDDHGVWWLRIMGRLRSGQGLESAQAAIQGMQPRIREATLPRGADSERRAPYLTEPITLEAAPSGISSLRNRYRDSVVVLMVVVGVVLLIACANIANLLLARAQSRQRELGVRRALGASRWRIARQLTAESLILSSAGALLGIAVAKWSAPLLVLQMSTPSSRVFLDLEIDWRVFGFTASIAVAVTILSGLVPALHAARLHPLDAIRSGGMPASAGGTGLPIAQTLLTGQVALSLVLVVAAGLFCRTFWSLATRDLGFDRNEVLLARLQLQQESDDEVSRRVSLYAGVAESVRALPGVTEAANSDVTPVSGLLIDAAVQIEGMPPMTLPENISFKNAVSPGWFDTYGTPILRGRDFDRGDHADSARVVVVNETFVRKFLGGEPVGRRIREAHRDEWLEIVGVASDAAYLSLREPNPPTIYVPIAQQDRLPGQMSLSLRTAGAEPSFLTQNVTDAVARVDRDIAITFTLLREQVDARLRHEKLTAMLSMFFGALASLLAGLGLYGITSYAASLRRGEIGVRMVLGATPSRAVSAVLSRIRLSVGAGLLLGASISWWVSRYVESLLFGVSRHDVPTLVAAAALLIAIAATASWFPARIASRREPALLLREE